MNDDDNDLCVLCEKISDSGGDICSTCTQSDALTILANTTTSPRMNKRHLSKEYKRNTIKCINCDQSFDGPSSYSEHYRRFHEGNNNKCMFCNENVLDKHNESANNIVINTSKHLINCDVYQDWITNNCKKSKINDVSSYRVIFPCRWCDQTFDELKSHANHCKSIHPNSKCYYCEIMLKTSNNSSNMEVIRRNHEQQCVVLQKWFIASTVFLPGANNKTPSPITKLNRIYNCIWCSSNFKSFDNYAKHCQNFHLISPTTCLYCNIDSKSHQNLINHVKTCNNYLNKSNVIEIKDINDNENIDCIEVLRISATQHISKDNIINNSLSVTKMTPTSSISATTMSSNNTENVLKIHFKLNIVQLCTEYRNRLKNLKKNSLQLEHLFTEISDLAKRNNKCLINCSRLRIHNIPTVEVKELLHIPTNDKSYKVHEIEIDTKDHWIRPLIEKWSKISRIARHLFTIPTWSTLQLISKPIISFIAFNNTQAIILDN